MEQRHPKNFKITNRDDRQISFITKYGQINAGTLKTGCKPFILATGIYANDLVVQNSEQMWCLLYNGLTKKAKTTLLTNQKDYIVIVSSEPKVKAPLIYKAMTRLATTDWNATITALITNLCELTQYAIK